MNNKNNRGGDASNRRYDFVQKKSEVKNLILDQNIYKILNGNFDDENIIESLENINKLNLTPNNIKIPKDYCSYRITKYEIWTFMRKHRNFNIINSLRYLNIMSKTKEEYVFWSLLSNLNLCNKTINFPVLYYYDSSCQNMFVEKYDVTILDDELLCITDKDIYLHILFQKLIILYNLYLNGISCDSYIFDYIRIKDFNYTFKVKDLFFNIKLSYLVVLSPRNNLMNIPNLEHNYLLSIGLDDINFVKTFLKMFITNLITDLYSSNLSLSLHSERLTNPEIGNVAIIKNNTGTGVNSSTYCIIDSVLGENVDVILINVSPKTTNLIELKNQKIENIYKTYNIKNISSNLKIIG